MTEDPQKGYCFSCRAKCTTHSGIKSRLDADDSIFFLFVERKVFCTLNYFTKSLFIWFAMIYVFNLEYDKNVKDVCLSFQEFLFRLPSSLCKKNSTYMSVTTDVQNSALF